MNDKDFDKLLKKQMQEDEEIPENINMLFSNFEREVEMKEESSKQTKIIPFFKKFSIAACALIVLATGGFAFATNMPEEWKESIKKFFGVISNESYEEVKVDVNEIKIDNEYEMTLNEYGIDSDTLLLNFTLKSERELNIIYPFLEEPDVYFFNNIKIINDDKEEYIIEKLPLNEYDEEYIEATKKILVNKINNKEYEIFEIYTIDATKITDNSTLDIEFYFEELPENADELKYERFANFDFEVPINEENIVLDYEEYNIDGTEIVLESPFEDFETNTITNEIAMVRLSKIKNSKIATKISVLLDGWYHTNTEYTVEILDENNKVILDRDIEYIYGLVPTEIVIPKVDMNSKLKINVYESEYTDEGKEDVARGSVIIDLSNL